MADAGLGLFNQMQQEFPRTQGLGLSYKYNPGGGPGMMESWPAQETGTPEHPRPREFPLGGLGLEVYDPKATPMDLMGDVTSHFLINNDPTVKQTYQDFITSMTPDQHRMLNEQYQYHQQNLGEQRPFEEWKEMTGLPAWLRGYAFKQWEHPEEMYTPEQMQAFDKMMDYLRTAQ